jgi:predicted transcriptional regulator
MARPASSDLTERELDVMHVFWALGRATAAEVREELAKTGPDLAYTTVATLIRILVDKQFVDQVTQERPFLYQPAKSYEEVSGRLLGNVLDRVFHGSRKQLLVRLMEEKALSDEEKTLLKTILREGKVKP